MEGPQRKAVSVPFLVYCASLSKPQHCSNIKKGRKEGERREHGAETHFRRFSSNQGHAALNNAFVFFIEEKKAMGTKGPNIMFTPSFRPLGVQSHLARGEKGRGKKEA